MLIFNINCYKINQRKYVLDKKCKRNYIISIYKKINIRKRLFLYIKEDIKFAMKISKFNDENKS